ncbi:hypothetical protein ACH5RR_017531 [Cinchona calisaya]|uniref:Wax synthase domain-containing protein n=1 Tax=Cinchona calisaya TaxID=153742 RepID=A0ABD2ZLS2_9GENT
MEGEIGNFIRVWASVFASVFYCYAVARIVAKGFIRLVMFFPVVHLFLVLPFTLTSVHLGCPTLFFISWLANFKLLLLAFGNGPLSEPSLSMGRFVILACFPVKVQENQNPSQPKSESRRLNGSPIKEEAHSSPKYYNSGLRKLSYFAREGLILAFLLRLGHWRKHVNPNIFLFCICMYVYIGLDLMLGIVASIGQFLLGIELEIPFNAPYLSTSLKDFWGQRWNRMASDILRSVVFGPIFKYSSRKVGLKWALIQALLATFLVSAMMHELILYYLGRTRPKCGTTLFFLIHGILLVVEAALKKKFNAKWALPQLITGPLIFGFMILTFVWLILPEVLEYEVDARALEEYDALGQFLKDLGIFLKESCYNCFLFFSEVVATYSYNII